jgi:gamma-glutamylcyclotransferase (GGCT)/AIG2-like uncharacterized protein YtfP
MTYNLFTYGALMFPDIIQTLAQRPVRGEQATLSGYASFTVKDECYSALIPFPDMKTSGQLYRGLDEATLKLVDEFQGDLYVRTEVTVEIGTENWVDAVTYLLAPESCGELSSLEWDELDFRENYLADWVKEARNLTR